MAGGALKGDCDDGDLSPSRRVRDKQRHTIGILLAIMPKRWDLQQNALGEAARG